MRFACSTKVTCGIFFVTKKAGRLRMILDARRSNVYFRKPPSRHNSSAACFGELRVPEGRQLYVGQYDVRDFFYRLGVSEELSQYFWVASCYSECFGQCLGGGSGSGDYSYVSSCSPTA